MLKKANIQWSAKQLTKSIEKGTINFDNAVQRGLCWDEDRKSLLIHSMIENYPIPAFFASKDENGYSMLDGKQRSNAISDFINNKFALVNVPEITSEDGIITDINGLTFEQLPEELQDTIKDYSLTVYYFDGITDDEITEMFFRLNNGKPLSAIELTRVKAKSIEQIKELSKHELFTSTLTEKAISKYTNEDIVIKSWALLNTENPSFETKYIRPLIETADITEQHVTDITAVYNRLLEAYQDIKAIDNKENNKIAKRVITRTHLLSLVPVIHDSLNSITVEKMVEFAKHFFSGKKSASISDTYNTASGSGSAKTENVKKRITAIIEEYNKFFNKSEQKENTPTPVAAKKVDYSSISDDEWQETFIPHNVSEALKYTY